MSEDQLKKAIAKSKKSMADAVKKLDFIEAARYRDEIKELTILLEKA